ncbi:MAG TPA: SRPBCC family protein [Candidatus Caccomonas pullistercoris]|nr:SRPBCC family protein [Candidatus Caccomonas pullistercoris]
MSLTKFESAVKQLSHPQQTVYDWLSDLRHIEALRGRLDDPALLEQLGERVPGTDAESLRQQLESMTFSEDTVTMDSPLGKVTLRIVEREAPKCVKLEAEGSPLPLTLWVQVLPVAEAESKMRVTLGAEVNVFMKAMVSKPLQQAVDGIADMLASLPYGE